MRICSRFSSAARKWQPDANCGRSNRAGGAPGAIAQRSTDAPRADMQMRFSDKVVLVAGGTGGLGRAGRLAFLEEGAKGVVTYPDQKKVDTLKSEAGASGLAIEGHYVDVTDQPAVGQLPAKIIAQQRRLESM